MLEIEAPTLEAILDNHYEHIQESSKAILEVLKYDSENYGELKKRLDHLKQGVIFRFGINKYQSIFTELDKMLEKEMNDLPL